MTEPHPLLTEFRALCEAHRDADRATAMAAYMKTDMPFYGVPQTRWKALVAPWKKRWPELGKDHDTWQQLVLDLWALPHREERYMAIWVASTFKAHLRPAALPLFERLIVEGAWWDLVDATVGGCVDPTFLKHRADTLPTLERWIEGEDLWLRRAAIISQLKHRGQTDTEFLFSSCERCLHEKDFFIRKAIGWALRQHSATDAEAVAAFVDRHAGQLSALSRREATRRLPLRYRNPSTP